jgi:hypothetical protein
MKLPKRTSAHFITDCGSGKWQRFIGQKVSVVRRGQLQTEICDTKELASVTDEAEEDAGQRDLPSRFSHCVKLVYCACVSSPPL